MTPSIDVAKFDFDKIFDKLIVDEGGYSNDPEDSGGETYKGISRKFHPENPIWLIIDSHKDQWNFEQFLNTSPELSKYVHKFYYDLYKKNKVNEFKQYNLKEKLFSMIVNMGESKAILILQRSFNLLKRSNVLAQDGIIGNEVLRNINNLIDKDFDDLMMFYRAELYCYYKQIIEKRPKDIKFIKGWARRAFLGI